MRNLLTAAIPMLLLSGSAFAQYDPGTVAKIQEEINMNNTRARQLDPIIARDTQARNDTGADASQLDNSARGMHARANEFRSVAGTLPGGPQRGQLMETANQLDGYATHNEQLAAGQRDLANRLSGMINLLTEGRNQHLAAAARLQSMLNGGGM